MRVPRWRFTSPHRSIPFRLAVPHSPPAQATPPARQRVAIRDPVAMIIIISCTKNDAITGIFPDEVTGAFHEDEKYTTTLRENDSVLAIVNHPAFNGFGQVHPARGK